MSEAEKVNILLVDDQPAKLLTYEAILKDLDATLIKASSAQEAFDYLLRNDVAVILVDVYMPELDGFQLASMVRDQPRFQKTAIIFISAIYLSELDRLRGYESGAVDYVPVPVVPEILIAKVKVFVELYRKTRALERLNRLLEDRVVERTAELKASNERLQQGEERMRLASEAAEFGTYDCNPRTGTIHCSPQMKRLLGWEGEGELTAEAYLNLVYEQDRSAVRRSLLAKQRSDDDRHRVEFRVAHNGGVRWLLDCGRAFFDSDDDAEVPARVMGTVLDLTERKQVEERQLLLMAELDHRVKNILANVGAIAKLSSKSTGSVGDFVEALDARIQAVAKAHSILRQDSWVGIDLRTYLSEILAPFINRQGKNIVLNGEPVDLAPKAAQSLALVFHELATNAVKYGALSAPNGKVTLSWIRSISKEGTVKLTWQELGGPAPSEPDRQGFGTTVINAVASELRSNVTYAFEPLGVLFTIEGAIERTAKVKVMPPGAKPFLTGGGPWHASERRVRILLVEDELLVGLQTKSDLETAGHKVVALATNIEQGMDFAENLEFDFALLDIRLGDDVSAPIAEKLLDRGLPFAFVTGFEDNAILPRHLRSAPLLAKPYELSTILAVISDLCGNAGLRQLAF
jgi:PAS domain S-box-containing protein